MKRLDRYLLGEMVLPYLGGALLIVVLLIGNTLYPLIQIIVKNGIPLSVVAKLVVFNIPALITLTMPAGVALAGAWAVNRLARDSEITAMRMAGISLLRLFAPVFVVGALSAAFAFFIGNRIQPYAQRQFEETQNQMFAYAFQASPTVAANEVFTYQNYSFHIRTIVKDPARGSGKLLLEGVLIYEESPDPAGFPVLYTAKTATYDHDVWTLNDFITHILDTQGSERAEIAGKTMRLNLRAPLSDLVAAGGQSPEETSTPQLAAELTAMRRTGKLASNYGLTVAYEYYERIGLPLVCLGFALCAPPLALRFARAGAYVGIFLSIIMVWVAWNTLLLTKFLGLSGKLSPEAAAWSPAVLFFFLGVLLLSRMEKS